MAVATGIKAGAVLTTAEGAAPEEGSEGIILIMEMMKVDGERRG